jgi:hypothetical protein
MKADTRQPEPSVILLDAVERMRRIKADAALLPKLGKGPIPMVTAPWQHGTVQHGFTFYAEQPPVVHLWSHFETFHSIEAMLNVWIIDEPALYGDEEDDGL